MAKDIYQDVEHQGLKIFAVWTVLYIRKSSTNAAHIINNKLVRLSFKCFISFQSSGDGDA